MFTRDDLIKGFHDLDRYLAQQGLSGEIAVYGGACLCLVYSARSSTKDVDAIFQPTELMRKAIFEVGIANGWDWNWVNDDVAGFLSDREVADQTLPEFESLENLTVLFPSPEYLLAMKCLAARGANDDELSPDLADAVWLAKSLHLKTRDDLSNNLVKFYSLEDLSSKTDFFLGEIVKKLDD